MSEMFQVSPVRRYEGARYLCTAETNGRLGEPEALWRQLSSVAMCALTLLFLSSCYRQREAIVIGAEPVLESPQQPIIVAVAPQPECAPTSIRCRDQSTLDTCQGGVWIPVSCDSLCRERFGQDYLSRGCSAAAADPCQCERDPNYDMVDGGMGYVTPSLL